MLAAVGGLRAYAGAACYVLAAVGGLRAYAGVFLGRLRPRARRRRRYPNFIAKILRIDDERICLLDPNDRRFGALDVEMLHHEQYDDFALRRRKAACTCIGE